MSKGELACTYAALMLHDDGIPVTADKIAAIVKAANAPVESYWPGLFAKLCEKRNIHDLIMTVGSGGGAPVVSFAPPTGDAPTAAAPADAAAAEAEKEDTDDEFMLDLFG